MLEDSAHTGCCCITGNSPVIRAPASGRKPVFRKLRMSCKSSETKFPRVCFVLLSHWEEDEKIVIRFISCSLGLGSIEQKNTSSNSSQSCLHFFWPSILRVHVLIYRVIATRFSPSDQTENAIIPDHGDTRLLTSTNIFTGSFKAQVRRLKPGSVW